MSKLMVKDGNIWVPMDGLKGDTGPLPADESIPDTALVTDGAKTNTAYLMRNRLTKDAEGELISVEDSYAVPPVNVNFDGGSSTQVITTGKNLLSDVPSEWVKRTFADLSGTIVSFPISIEDGASYYYVKTTGSGMSPDMYGGFCDALDGTITIYDRVTLSNYSSYTFTNSGSHSYLIFFAASRNTTASQITNQFLSRKIFVSRNSSDTYEVYSGGAASPRPDWPQEIISRTNLTLKTCGKNFVPNDDPENPNANYTFNSSKHVVWDSEMEGFRLTDSGSGVAYTAHSLKNTRAAFIAPQDGIYTFGADTKYYTSGTDFAFRVDVNGTTINGYGWGSPKQSSDTEWTRHSITRTLSKGDRFGATIYQTCLWRRISVVAGSEDIYEPYSGGTVSLLPEGASLRSLPDGTKDELYLKYLRPSSREGWAWYEPTLVQRVATQSCSGNENWKIYRNYAFFKTMPSARLMKTGKKELLCDAYKSAASTSIESAGNAATSPNTIFGRNGETDAIIKTSVAYNTVNDFKAALAENPIVIQYPLATPITETLDPIELPIMQAGITNLWSDPSTNLSVTYERDRNIVITNLKAAVADLATS